MIELFDNSSPLNSTTIYPKCDHTLYSILITKTKWPYNYTFALSPFCFSLSSFPSLELDHHHHMSTNMIFIQLLHHLGCVTLSHDLLEE